MVSCRTGRISRVLLAIVPVIAVGQVARGSADDPPPKKQQPSAQPADQEEAEDAPHGEQTAEQTARTRAEERRKSYDMRRRQRERNARARAESRNLYSIEQLDELEDAYWDGVRDGRDLERVEIQAEKGLSGYRRAMWDGHAAFSAGQYGPAARNFLLAATLNQGDPAARVCAAHSQTALGRYETAVRLLHRAFELEPRMAYLPIDIRKAYGQPGDFAKHLEKLSSHTEAQPENADGWLLLGYYYFFSNDTERAAMALRTAQRLRPNDPLTELLYDVARMTTQPPGSQKPPQKARRVKPAKSLSRAASPGAIADRHLRVITHA